jgi:hypothetical protein
MKNMYTSQCPKFGLRRTTVIFWTKRRFYRQFLRASGELKLLSAILSFLISIKVDREAQCFGSGSVLIRYDFAILDPDPYWECESGSGARKLTKFNQQALLPAFQMAFIPTQGPYVVGNLTFIKYPIFFMSKFSKV